MSDIREILNQQLRQGDLDLLDIVPVPATGDRMVRLRTLEEALDDFEESGGLEAAETTSYLIQVRARRGAGASAARGEPPTPQAAQPSSAPRAPVADGESALPAAPHRPSAATASPVTGENIYLPDGKLNIAYVARNADLLLSAGEHALARSIYKAILASGERKGMALFGIARCDEEEGRLDEARANYEESIAYHPHLEAYHRLGAVLMAQDKDQLAAEALERALNLKDLDEATRFELHKACGNCWARARTREPAERHYLAAIAIDPAADEIRANLGALCLQSQDVVAAKRHFEDAMASNPSNAKAHAGLGSCFLAEGDKRRAHDCFARSLELDLQNPTAVYHLVKCAYEIRSYATAARVVEDYLRVAPANANLLYSLAGLQFHLGRAEDARATARRILELNAEHSGAKELLNLIERFGQA